MMKKRILAVALSLIMLVGLMPTMAGAASETVMTEAELTAALGRADVDEIVLGGSIEVASTVEIEGVTVTIDLNGHRLGKSGAKKSDSTPTIPDAVITVKSGDVTVTDSAASNGEGVVISGHGAAVLVSGGVVTLRDVNVSGADKGVRVNGGELIVDNGAVVRGTKYANGSFTGDGIRAYNASRVTVKAGGAVEANMPDDDLEGTGIEIYHSASVVVESGASVKGDWGVEMYGGSLDTAGDIYGRDTAVDTTDNMPNNPEYLSDVTINVSGGKLEGAWSLYFDGAVHNTEVNISGGNISGRVEESPEVQSMTAGALTVNITGGKFDDDAGEGIGKYIENSGYVKDESGNVFKPYAVTFRGDTDTVLHTDRNGIVAAVPTAPEKEHYTVVWQTDTGYKLTDAAYVFTADTVVTLLYTPEVYTVTFDRNDGSTEPYASVDAVYNTSLDADMPANPTRGGYRFDEWNTAADGSGEAFDDAYAVSADMTVYAVWTRNSTGVTPAKPSEPTVEPSDEPDMPAVGDFSDLDPNAWYADAIEFVLENGIMKGMGDGTFEPLGTLTRAQMAQILYNLEGEPQVGAGASVFDDVAADAWYFVPVMWAAENGIVEGYNGRFNPDDDVTREQMAAMIYRYAAYKGVPTTAAGDLGDFADGGDVSAWFVDEVSWAVGMGLLNGNGDGTLNPLGNSLRAEAAQIVMNAAKVLGIAE